MEKLFIGGQRPKEIHLSPDNVAFHLIQQIRNEAHCFVITANRAQCIKRRIESYLENIKGVGPKPIRELLKYLVGYKNFENQALKNCQGNWH